VFHKVSYMWFRGTPYITSIGLFYKNREVCGGLSDCEELVGVTHRGWWGWYMKIMC